MLSSFNIALKILQSFFDKDLIKLNEVLSKTKIEELTRAIDRGVKKELDKVLQSIEVEVRSKLKKEYNNFIKRGAFRVNPNLQKYKINELKPEFKKDLEKRVNLCLSYIKTLDNQAIEDIKNRLMNWALDPSPAKSMKEYEYNFWENILPDKVKRNFATTKWQNMIIRDQQHKLVSNMTYLTAMKNDAIGFIWKNRKDIRVVGNPVGLYPKGNKVHNNHWDRENKLYLFRESSFLKKGLIKRTKDVYYADELEDGIPGVPINCRCTMRVIYRLYEIPAEYKGIITEKGKEFA